MQSLCVSLLHLLLLPQWLFQVISILFKVLSHQLPQQTEHTTLSPTSREKSVQSDKVSPHLTATNHLHICLSLHHYFPVFSCHTVMGVPPPVPSKSLCLYTGTHPLQLPDSYDIHLPSGLLFILSLHFLFFPLVLKYAQD